MNWKCFVHRNEFKGHSCCCTVDFHKNSWGANSCRSYFDFELMFSSFFPSNLFHLNESLFLRYFLRYGSIRTFILNSKPCSSSEYQAYVDLQKNWLHDELAVWMVEHVVMHSVFSVIQNQSVVVIKITVWTLMRWGKLMLHAVSEL